MFLVKSQRNIHFWVRFQIESMKLEFWWKHLRYLVALFYTKR